MKVMNQSSLVKLIHGWHPMYGSLCWQGRKKSTLCPCYATTVETHNHFLMRPAPDATDAWSKPPKSFLLEIKRIHSVPCLLTTFEYKLSLTLDIPYSQTYQLSHNRASDVHRILLCAMQHQNVLGWDSALKASHPNIGMNYNYLIYINLSFTPIGMKNWSVCYFASPLNYGKTGIHLYMAWLGQNCSKIYAPESSTKLSRYTNTHQNYIHIFP